MDLPEIITPALIAYIRETYALNWYGLHGWEHWVRVWEIGQRLSVRNGANQQVVALFAFTHDMARLNDVSDRDHGPRAAKRIQGELQGKFFELAPQELSLLVQAVREHTHGLQEADLTVQTCWDSDRLDLGRAGITPDPIKLCTHEARDPEILHWAHSRSVAWKVK